jgi:putative nucleotidyltransferase with HDIG domain
VPSPVAEILASAAKLQPFPKVAQKALELLENPDVSATKLVQVIELDAHLTAAVLRTVNSAFHALPQRVDNLKQALTYLGNGPFRELIFGTASAPFLASGQQGYDLSPGDLWRHSVAVSLMTQVLCERLERKPGPALFTAALLHDLGKAVLSSFVHDRTVPILELVKKGVSFLEAERTVLEMDHAELGARIAEGWNFSPQMVELIRYHHEPERRPESAEVAILYLSNLVCQLYGLGGGVDALAMKGQGSVLVKLNLKLKDVEAAMAELHVRLAKAESMLSLGA